MDGGCLTNQGIHHIDLFGSLGGEVARVSAVHATLGADIEVEDTATASIEFENRAVGALEITTAARPIDFEASLSLVCENGLAQIGGIAVNELQIYTPDPGACAANSEDFSGNVYGFGHVKLYEEIVASLAEARPFSSHVSGHAGDHSAVECPIRRTRKPVLGGRRRGRRQRLAGPLRRESGRSVSYCRSAGMSPEA